MNRIADHIIAGEGTKIHADDPMICTHGRIGANCKIGNGTFIPDGVTLEDGVLIGPNVTFVHDKYPRAIHADGRPVLTRDWPCLETLVKQGAAIGGASCIGAGVTIGRFAMVGMGSVVTHDVPDFMCAYGVPARVCGLVPDYEKYRSCVDNGG